MTQVCTEYTVFPVRVPIQDLIGPMTLRRKTVLIFGATLLGLLIGSYAVVSSILMRGFLSHEQGDAIQNVERIQEVIADSLVGLSTKAWDWANWDDLYRFAAEPNPEFVSLNLMDKTFVELNLNAILIVDSSSRLVYARVFDHARQKEAPLPQTLKDALASESPLLQHPDPASSMTGLVGFPENPLLIAARPILTSAGLGPIRGTLIMGAFLNEDKIRYMGRETKLQFSVETLPLRHGQAPEDFRTAFDALRNDQPIFIRPLSEERIAGYSLLNDISGKPIAMLRVLLPREIYRQGRTTLNYLAASLLLLGLVYSVVTLLLTETWILSRVINIIKGVGDIGRNADSTVRLPVTGNDELSTLVLAINAMLSALESSERELRRLNEDLEARVVERTVELARVNESLRTENAERRKIDEALRRSEVRFRELFMNAPIGIFQSTPDGRLLTANPALAATLGYKSPEALIAEVHNLAVQVHVDPLQRESLLETARQSDSQFRFEGRFVRRDGATIIAELQGRAARDDNGRIVRLEGFAEDITERKHLEQILREARENLEMVVEQRTAELKLKTEHLEEANAALKALLRQRDIDREEFGESILANVKTLILPCIEKLKRGRPTGEQLACVETLESHLLRITSPFVARLSQPFLGLTPMEIQVADLLRSGKSSKEIAVTLCLSESTVLFHRNNLRTKLGLKGKKTNLRSYLQSLQ